MGIHLAGWLPPLPVLLPLVVLLLLIVGTALRSLLYQQYGVLAGVGLGTLVVVQLLAWVGLVAASRIMLTGVCAVSIGALSYAVGNGDNRPVWTERLMGHCVLALVTSFGLLVWNWILDPPTMRWSGVAIIAVPTMSALISFVVAVRVNRLVEVESQRDHARRAKKEALAEELRRKKHEQAQARAEREESYRVRRRQEEEERISQKREKERRAKEMEELRRMKEKRIEDQQNLVLDKARALDGATPFAELQRRDRVVLECLARLHSPRSAVPFRELVAKAAEDGIPEEQLLTSLLRSAEMSRVRINDDWRADSWQDKSVFLEREGRQELERNRQGEGAMTEIKNSQFGTAVFGGIFGGQNDFASASSYDARRNDALNDLLAAVEHVRTQVDAPTLEESADETARAIRDGENPTSFANQVIGVAKTLGDVGVPVVQAAKRLIDAFT